MATCDCLKPGNRPDAILLFYRRSSSCASFNSQTRKGAGLLGYRHFAHVENYDVGLSEH